MKLKQQQLNLISLFLVLSIVIGNCVSPIVAYAAESSTESITGSEDATNVEDFNGNVTAQNKYKIWSVCKSYGLTDNQALGIMGCFAAECSFHPEATEGYFEWGSSVESVEEYIANHSMPFALDHDAETVNLLSSGYSISSSSISSARTSSGVSENGINVSAYFIGGTGYKGIGIAQFTGNRSKLLLDWSIKNSCDWWIMENQLSWMLLATAEGGDSSSATWESYKAATADYSLEECTEWWALHYENGSMPSDDVAQRITLATDLSIIFGGKAWDIVYGDTIVSGAGLQPSKAKNGINDKSILFSYASNILNYKSNSGFSLNKLANDKLDDKNKDVFNGLVSELKGGTNDSEQYCLYELYGQDIHWYRYMGEATYSPALLDHVWSAVDQNKTSKLSKEDTIDYSATNYLSCHVYDNRPTVLTVEDIANGYNDPRVLALSIGWFNGYGYVLGSLDMAIAKNIVSLVSLLIGHSLMDIFVEVLDSLEKGDNWKLIQIPVLTILGLAIIFFIVSLVSRAKKYAVGQGSAKEIISRFIIGFISLGLLFAAMYRPAVFNQIILKSLTAVDQLFEASLSASINGDEVVDVTDDDMVVQAVLWKTCIFNAWCRGQFDNLEYNELYTNFATLEDGQKAMPQSREVLDLSDTTGKAFYNSTDLIGDVYVPIGAGKNVRNWAAFLYSCGSTYHIDSTFDAKAAESINTEKFSFPMAKTTANDSSIYADTFKVIDAQMDISPQYYTDGTKSNNYSKSHKIKTHYIAQGTVMLFNALLLFMMIPPIFKKLTSFMMLMITIVQLIYFTILEIFKPDTGLKEFLETFKKHALAYFTSSIKINIMIVLYAIFVDKGIFMSMMYIIVCLTVLGFNIKDARRFISNAKHNIQKVKNSF